METHLHLSSNSRREVRIIVVFEPGVLKDLSDFLDAEQDSSIVDGVDIVREDGEVGFESDGVNLSLQSFAKEKGCRSSTSVHHIEG